MKFDTIMPNPLLLLFVFSFSFSFCFAQEEIFLENPSFEDFPKLSHTPASWFDCGFPGESQVDIHPVPASEFQVDKEAIDGESYLGMITRENETWEAIGQRLSQPLIGGKTYSFSIHLARSATYTSALSSRAINPTEIKKLNFATPIKLKIWGGSGYCKKDQLLAESSLVVNTRWLNFDFILNPKGDLSYITFEAFYQTPTAFAYNGNILLDGASSILEIENAEVMYEDSMRVAYLDSLTNAQTFNSTKSDIRHSEKSSTLEEEKQPKYILNKGPHNDFYRSKIINIQFEDDGQYLTNKAIDALIEIAQHLKKGDNAIVFNLKGDIDMLLTARRKRIQSLLISAGLKKSKIRFRKNFKRGDKVLYQIWNNETTVYIVSES